MRELKFRCWDPVLNKWSTDFTGVNPDGSYSFYTSYGQEVSISADRSRCTVQQYTGLKDSTGVEIYEGDLVISRMPNGTPTTRPRVVEWVENQRAIGFNIGVHKTTTIEVIGNIYETEAKNV